MTKDQQRILAGCISNLKEAAYDSAKGELTMTVIRPGFNKSKSRYYPAATLRRDHKIFEGAKMFTDHQTESEQKAQPEGSVHKWVASVNKVWAEADGTIKARAIVIDPPFKAKLDRLNESALLSEMGVSIRAIGHATEKNVEGTDTKFVESLLASRSVDFVTYAGAGGQVETIESDRGQENDVDLINETELRTRRPDLITLIESNASKELTRMKTLEEQLQESTTALATEKEKNGQLEKQIQEANKKVAQAAIASLITESKLPEVAQTKLRKQFEASESVEGVAEAITLEQDYIKSLGAPATSATRTVRNMGSEHNSSESAAAVTAEKTGIALVEAYKGMGMSEKEAKLAAGR